MSPTSTVALPSERSFGLLFAVLLGITAAWFLYSRQSVLAAVCIAFSLALLLLAAFKPSLLARPNRLWFKFGMILNAVVSPLVLGAIFFLLIAPIAFFFRAIGRDALNRRYGSSLNSYWVERTPPGPKPDSLKNQF